MPLWNVEEWRARIGSCWCALGRPINTRFTRNRGKSRRVLTLRQLLTMVIMVMLLIVANLVLCAMHLKMSSELFDGGGNWKLSLLRFVLILNISLGVLTTTIQTIYHNVLSYQAQVSLRQFSIDLAHSLWLICYLFQILIYPGWLMITSLQNGITASFKGIYKNLIKCTYSIPGHVFPPGSLRLSLAIVVMVGAQLFISMSISHAVISVLLMTSGDVERNPGPTQSVIKITGITFGGTISLLVLLLQAMTAVQTTLLMRSGDVEMNPGPGLYPDLDYDDVDSTIILSQDDFREVFRCTVDLKTCYYELGIEFGLPPQAIQDKAVDNPFAGVLLAWLNQYYDIGRYGVPTWRRLVEAVDNPAGGNNHELAKTIASKHPTVQIQPKESAAVLNNAEVNMIFLMAVEHYRSWKSIGLELGIKGAALDAIEKKYINDHRRLIAMIELWHASVDLNPSWEAMTKALQSNRVTTSVVDFTPSRGEPLLEQRDYSCKSEVMVDGDIFTYPYYWNPGQVLAVKILQPLTPAKNYFEQKILSPGVKCVITIGVVGRNYPLDMQPGWVKEGIGYHADDGGLFNENGRGTLFGPMCTAGDRMGCGVVFEDTEDVKSSDYVKVFFTKNGKQVGDIVDFRRPASGQGLYPLMGFSSRGEQVQYLGMWHHLPNVSQVPEHNNEEKKGYEEELSKLLASEGHVELDISKVILTGAAGSGKTCTKLLLYKLPPPAQRHSTELIEPMDRAYIKHELAYHEENDSEYEWIMVESGSESLYSMLAATVDSGEYTVLCEHEYTDGGSTDLDEESESSLPKPPTIVQSSDSNSRLPPELSKESTLSSKKADSQQKQIERLDSKARESLLMKMKNSADQKGVRVHKVRWIHLVDSGGQSQFHDILPTFLHHTSVIIYVLKLSEPLNDQPFDNYFEDGECLGESRRSHYDVEQILNGVIQSAYYEKHNKANKKHTTKILIIGTHKDVQAGGESIDVKNSKMKEIFEPFVGSRQLEVLCHGDYNADDIIFPLDAMKRDQESLGTGRVIRKRIITCSKGSKTHKVPISWFLLEQDLRSVGGEENNGIITIGECTKLAEAINVSKVKSALEYFHSLNIFIFFPHSSVLSEIVFTDPQVVVTIVSAFVKEAYQKVTDTEFKNFSERGEFTESFVKSKLSRFLVPAARFKEAEVIELLMITLIVAHIEEGRYFMPCVLPHCSLDEFEKERKDLEVPAVVLKLPGDTHCVPRGFFCALVCGLMKKWKLRKKKGKEVDVFKNFVQFTVDGYRVVVADTFYYIEIHVTGCDPDKYICRKIYEDIGEALKVVVNTHNYNNEIVESYSLDFVCPCGSAPAHTALISTTGRKQRLNCTRDDDETFKLENKFLIWLEDPVPESAVQRPPILKQESESKLKINLGALLILKYTESDKGEKKKVRIISKASHKWKDIASLLSKDANVTSVLEQKHRGDPSECLKETFTEYFINKKPEEYSQDWDGMIELLDDVGLEALAEEVKHALSFITSA